jgi:hypothetical protein
MLDIEIHRSKVVNMLEWTRLSIGCAAMSGASEAGNGPVYQEIKAFMAHHDLRSSFCSPALEENGDLINGICRAFMCEDKMRTFDLMRKYLKVVKAVYWPGQASE